MKMKELLSNNEEYIQFIENQHNWYWKVIDNIGWYYLAKEYKDEASDKVSEFLVNNNLSIEEIANLHNFVVEKREIVKNFILSYLRGCPSYEKIKYKLNEEETWDLASHIVGMGKVIMDLVLRKPEIIFILQNIKQANFEYGFDSAIYKIQNEDFS